MTVRLSPQTIERFQAGAAQVCAVPGCGRPTTLASGNGIARQHCRRHVVHKARHGSLWHPTYRAAELRPYIKAAERWLILNRAAPSVGSAKADLAWTLAFAGRVDPAMNLRGRSSDYRAQVAFARLEAAGVTPDRLLAICIGVAALIEDDLGSHRAQEFRIVQTAKAAHRLASGTHRRWEILYGRGGQIELHVYPRSSGLVLRKIGEQLEKACSEVVASGVSAVIDLKTHEAGQHPSRLPGWRPVWAIKK